MNTPTINMCRAIKTIATLRGDVMHMSWMQVSQMSYQDASDYIAKYGRKVRVQNEFN